jgi:alkanesulfonate monooxygenase SsuD/methylene tetrahydromethanopterin reductase-like flavin-dependent oxidoreductase (luciferase family)
MKASLLCGAHYAEAGAHRPGVLPSECDPHVAQVSFERWLRYAATADELGFDWISVSEHHYSPLILVPSVGPIAGALTQIVRRARIALLGPLVSINNPIRVAEEIAMLDQLSGGRLVVLLLRGTPSEFRAYEPIDPALTQEKTQAATRLVRKALTDTAPFAWQDEFFNYPNIAIWPRPLQQPLPPMLLLGQQSELGGVRGAGAAWTVHLVCGCHALRHGTHAVCRQPANGRRASESLPITHRSGCGGPRVQLGANHR